MRSFLILGCGYTATRVARSLAEQGFEVTCTNQRPRSLSGVRCLTLDVTDHHSIAALDRQVAEGSRILYSIPGVEPATNLMTAMRAWKPRRVVYLSTTGVYGAANWVDHTTTPAANDERSALRLRTEQMLADGPWSTLVLRPAAIYGPDRGVHFSVLRGDYARAATWNRLVSRIHVDDLADYTEAALLSDLNGQYPIADEGPARSLDVAFFAARLLGKTLPDLAFEREDAGRHVDGSAFRRCFKLGLHYPSYREGVTAAFRGLNLDQLLPVHFDGNGALQQ